MIQHVDIGSMLSSILSLSNEPAGNAWRSVVTRESFFIFGPAPISKTLTASELPNMAA